MTSSSSAARPGGTTVSSSSPPAGVSFATNGADGHGAGPTRSSSSAATDTNGVVGGSPSLLHANGDNDGDGDGGGTQSSPSHNGGGTVGFEEEQEALGGAGEVDLALEAEKLNGGVLRARMRSRSSMYRSEASLSMARRESEEMERTGLPPELVVAEDKEVGAGRWVYSISCMAVVVWP